MDTTGSEIIAGRMPEKKKRDMKSDGHGGDHYPHYRVLNKDLSSQSEIKPYCPSQIDGKQCSPLQQQKMYNHFELLFQSNHIGSFSLMQFSAPPLKVMCPLSL